LVHFSFRHSLRKGKALAIHPANTSQILAAVVLSLCAASAAAQELQRGTIIERVECAADRAQSYALYLPSTYAADRPSSLLLAFHPAGRGRLMVEKFQAAAEQYGFIVAASNNSRNGPWEVSTAAAQAMSSDVSRRFAIDARRVYLAGMSGGARVAMGIALGRNNIAGVIASSAGYPDSQPRPSVPFAVFSTAGTEDFNYIEMRLLDRKLSSPHFLAVFPGGHMLPPDDVAFDAIEWMELQAMQSGLRGRDAALAERIAAKRRARIAAARDPAQTVHLLTSFVSDFKGLVDSSAEATRLDEMSRRSDVKKAVKRERDADSDEGRLLADIFGLEARLTQDEGREAVLMTLRERLSRLRREAAAESDSPARSQARRVLRAITAGAPQRVQDREYLTLLEQYRLPGR
jgi:dienelactone hydrolase